MSHKLFLPPILLTFIAIKSNKIKLLFLMFLHLKFDVVFSISQCMTKMSKKEILHLSVSQVIKFLLWGRGQNYFDFRLKLNTHQGNHFYFVKRPNAKSKKL